MLYFLLINIIYRKKNILIIEILIKINYKVKMYLTNNRMNLLNYK